MAGSLTGVTFFQNSNNGVTALIREDLQQNNEKVTRIHHTLEPSKLGQVRDAIYDALSHIPQKPVFTFVSRERLFRHPWFTGDETLLVMIEEYIRKEGGTVTNNSSVWVPFSNGSEMGLHGLDAQRDELAYVTSEADFVAMFGTTSVALDWAMSRG